MTTSFDVDSTGQASSNSSMPKYNSQGYETWNPSVGRYFKPAAVKRESYGGIIGALQDIHVSSSGTTKSYPENFAGIIAALQDLSAMEYQPGSDTGEKPPGGEIIIDENGDPIWIITEKPTDGALWFDTRQGRLFVWVEDDWYQTNGADGLPIVTDDQTPPDVGVVVPGQFWWDVTNSSLYIFDGTYMLPDGSTTLDPTVGGTPIWRFVTSPDDENLQNTATLPLAVMGPRVTALEDNDYLPNLDLSEGNMTVQKDFNEWIFQSLLNLDNGLSDFNPVIIDETPPPTPTVGQLWYDTASLELSIYYEDADRGQWVPTSVAYSYDQDLATLSTRIDDESAARERAIDHIRQSLADFDVADNQDIEALEAAVAAANQRIDTIPTYDLSPFVTSNTYTLNTSQLTSRIAALEGKSPEYALATSQDALEDELDALSASLSNYATVTSVNAVKADIPDVSSFVTQQNIDDAINGITVDYLPRTGGTVDGSFIVNKSSYDLPAFDFSLSNWTSNNAFKFVSNGPVPATATFGTNTKAWEYAWDFKQEEDFCWVYNDSNKVFSITKEGPACSTLYLGDFQPNNNNGRVILNKIDVKERLNTYQSALEQVRQGVASSTDFDSLKANIISALANV